MEQAKNTMRKITINVPTDIIAEALNARTPDNTNYQRVLRRWLRLGMEAERRGMVADESSPHYSPAE